MVLNKCHDGDYQHHHTLNTAIIEWNETLNYVNDELIVQDKACPFSAPPADNVKHNAYSYQADYGAFDVVLPLVYEVPVDSLVQLSALEAFLPIRDA